MHSLFRIFLFIWLVSPLSVFAQEAEPDFDEEEEALSLAEARESLIKHSPFGATAQETVQDLRPQAPPRYELHGIMNLGGIWQFSLFDPKTKVSQWIALNDATSAIKVMNFNQQKNSIIIMDNGQLQELVLKKPDSSGSSGGLSSLMSALGGGGGSSPSSKDDFLELLKSKQKQLEQGIGGPPTRKPADPKGSLLDIDDEDEDDEDEEDDDDEF